jgi:hypothetical protein
MRRQATTKTSLDNLVGNVRADPSPRVATHSRAMLAKQAFEPEMNVTTHHRDYVRHIRKITPRRNPAGAS